MGDKYKGQVSATSFGSAGEVATPANTDIAEFAKAVVVTGVAGGDVLQILPTENADGDYITFTGVSVGFQPPFRVRQVGAATTCSAALVFDK